jgi:hypothetical protein
MSFVQEVEDVVFWSKILLAVGTGILLGLAGIEGWCVCTRICIPVLSHSFTGKGLSHLLVQWLWRL